MADEIRGEATTSVDKQITGVLVTVIFIGFFVLLMGGLIVASIVARRREQERTRQMVNIAGLLGWQFSEAAGLNWIPNLETFALFNQGHSKQIKNAMYGEIDGVKAAVFDYYYVVGSGKNRTTYNQSVVYFEPTNLNLPHFSLRPEHLSFYLLEVHQGTPLANHIKSGLQPQPDGDLAAEMYEVMLDRAIAEGYEHYEISNLCLPGLAARHNTKYWTAVPYYGFGCSAHSYDGGSRRWANERDLVQYMAMIEGDSRAIVEETQLTEADRQAEAVFLGLRMMHGFSFSRYQDVFGTDLREKHENDLRRFREAGLIECNGDLLRLTRAGALMSNEVFAAFV